MPPPRRANAPSSRNRGQSTLSFGSRSRVTKASLPIQPVKKKDAAVLHADEQVNTPAPPPPPVAEEVPPTTVEIAIKQQATEERARTVSRTRTEKSAAAVSDAQLKRYWRALEAERKAPRVHQGDLTVAEKILRHFDLSSQYGPCVGIARMKRWKRAQKLNLHPPIEVLAVLLNEEDGGHTKSERAYIDELLSSRFVTE